MLRNGYSFSEVAVEDDAGEGDDAAGADDRKEGQYIDGGHLILIVSENMNFEIGPNGADPEQD